LSFRSALASICRIRSRVTENCWPTSSSVWSLFMPRPKRLRTMREPLSLETPIGDEGDSHLGDLIEDKNAILPIDAMIQSNLRETTTRILASLTPREERRGTP
jgi:hypothetical protein